MKTVLHVGCGMYTIRDLPPLFQNGDWEEIRYDINPDVNPDIVGELQDMSLLEDASVDALHSSHNIEHVWGFEVPGVLKEFRRVLKPDGFALVRCPDMLSVAQAINEGLLDKPVYTSPVGPITTLDIIYGYQPDIQRGNHFMAHKTGFTARSLAAQLERAGFTSSVVVRDVLLGLHALALPPAWRIDQVPELLMGLMPDGDSTVEATWFGEMAEQGNAR